ncbi:hypothetical protein BJV74DRAFT_867241 [Russula compacta]|nr:hypothetical protein BJV74DRAFT_867241 [Russula compacta]
MAPDASEREHEDGGEGGAHAEAVVLPVPPLPVQFCLLGFLVYKADLAPSGRAGANAVDYSEGDDDRRRWHRNNQASSAWSASSASRLPQLHHCHRLCSLCSVRSARVSRIRLHFRASICASCYRSACARDLLCATPSACSFGLGRESWAPERAGSM